MMRKAPEERYQTPLEVAQALEPFAVESGGRRPRPPCLGPAAAPTVADAAVALASAAAPVATAEASGRSRFPGGRGGQRPSNGANGTLIGLGLEIDLGPVPMPSGSGSGNLLAGASRSSGSAPGVGDSFFPLDLGPDAPLGEGLKPGPRSRSKSKSSPTPTAQAPVRPGRRGDRRRRHRRRRLRRAGDPDHEQPRVRPPEGGWRPPGQGRPTAKAAEVRGDRRPVSRRRVGGRPHAGRGPGDRLRPRPARP